MTKLLDTREAAAFLGLSATSLEHWRGLRKGPPFVRVGPRAIRYAQTDLEAWLAGQAVATEN